MLTSAHGCLQLCAEVRLGLVKIAKYRAAHHGVLESSAKILVSQRQTYEVAIKKQELQKVVHNN